MKRLFLDTNFIIDYFVRDDYRSVSEQLLVEGAKRGYEFCIDRKSTRLNSSHL